MNEHRWCSRPKTIDRVLLVSKLLFWCKRRVLVCGDKLLSILNSLPTLRCQQVIARHEGHLGYEGQVEFLRKVPDFDV